jgi:hypothetical protein
LEELDSAGERLSLVHDLAIRCKGFSSYCQVLDKSSEYFLVCFICMYFATAPLLLLPFSLYLFAYIGFSMRQKVSLSLMTMLRFFYPINSYDASMLEFLSLDVTSICTILSYLRVHDIGGEMQEKKTTIKSSSIRVQKPSRI